MMSGSAIVADPPPPYAVAAPPPSPQGTITTSLPTILCGVEAAGPKNCTSGPVLCRRREVAISQS